MSDAPTTQVGIKGDAQVEARDRSASDALDVLARALDGRVIPVRPAHAIGPRASPAEGLALVEDFIAIEDPAVRQALLDTMAALAG